MIKHTNKSWRAGVVALALSGSLSLASTVSRADEALNDFPTITRADYIFACMQVNGQSREALEKCSCSVDVIASLIPHDEYEAVETIIMVFKRGGKAQQQMSNGDLQRRIQEMRRAQVEGELRCF
jgi:hypothetical protein